MATQAVVSVVRNGNTVVKCVAGCEGFNADALAAVIATRHIDTVQGVHNAAIEVGYGCNDCLVTQGEDETIYQGSGELSTLYSSKFDDPHFNPRWGVGWAAWITTVDADTWEVIDVAAEVEK